MVHLQDNLQGSSSNSLHCVCGELMSQCSCHWSLIIEYFPIFFCILYMCLNLLNSILHCSSTACSIKPVLSRNHEQSYNLLPPSPLCPNRLQGVQRVRDAPRPVSLCIPHHQGPCHPEARGRGERAHAGLYIEVKPVCYSAKAGTRGFLSGRIKD